MAIYDPNRHTLGLRVGHDVGNDLVCLLTRPLLKQGWIEKCGVEPSYRRHVPNVHGHHFVINLRVIERPTKCPASIE